MFKRFITSVLEWQAKRLLLKYKPKIVAVTGSVGKTSTKLAIATVLGQRYKVLAQYGSYNTEIGLPMAIFNMPMPAKLRSLSAWLKVFSEREKQIRTKYPFDVLVLELGADKLGDIGYFKKYIKPDIGVVTAVSVEHMASFGSLDNIAAEELSITHFAKLSLINRDNIDGVFSKLVPDDIDIDTYGTSGVAEYRFIIDDFTPGHYSGQFISPELGQVQTNLHLV